MSKYFMYLIIGWSLACIGIFIVIFQVTKAEYQKREYFVTILKNPSKLTGSPDDIRIREAWKEMERRNMFAEFIAHAKAKADSAESVKYVESVEIDDKFYWILPLVCFSVWSVPIIVFSLLGLFFKSKSL